MGHFNIIQDRKSIEDLTKKLGFTSCREATPRLSDFRALSRLKESHLLPDAPMIWPKGMRDSPLGQRGNEKGFPSEATLARG